MNLPKVGVGVIVRKGGLVLVGRRKNAHGDGTWNFPGGHLEYGETPEQTAEREVMEEAGITIKNLRRGPYTNDVFTEKKHYITLFILADYDRGTPAVKEPEKCEEWRWVRWDNIPEPMFLPIEHLKETDFTPDSRQSP